MQEIEVPVEQAHKDLEHAASHGLGERWITWGALTSAMFAVLAAVAALQAGHLADEGMLEQIRASDHWSHYQAKSIKANLLETRQQILQSLGKPVDSSTQQKLAEYGAEQNELQQTAQENERASERYFARYRVFSRAVTMLQIAIAVAAIAVLARRRAILSVSAIFGIIGGFYIFQGFVS
jgi:lipopolysaccharide export LptBFGC system permease protein LptF